MVILLRGEEEVEEGFEDGETVSVGESFEKGGESKRGEEVVEGEGEDGFEDGVGEGFVSREENEEEF